MLSFTKVPQGLLLVSYLSIMACSMGFLRFLFSIDILSSIACMLNDWYFFVFAQVYLSRFYPANTIILYFYYQCIVAFCKAQFQVAIFCFVSKTVVYGVFYQGLQYHGGYMYNILLQAALAFLFHTLFWAGVCTPVVSIALSVLSRRAA